MHLKPSRPGMKRAYVHIEGEREYTMKVSLEPENPKDFTELASVRIPLHQSLFFILPLFLDIFSHYNVHFCSSLEVCSVLQQQIRRIRVQTAAIERDFIHQRSVRASTPFIS